MEFVRGLRPACGFKSPDSSQVWTTAKALALRFRGLPRAIARRLIASSRSVAAVTTAVFRAATRRELILLPARSAGRRVPHTALIETPYGIKPILRLCTAFDYLVLSRVPLGTIGVEQIVGHPDFLIDEHTNIGAPILQMPHYDLIRSLATGRPLGTCDYLRRSEMGLLDWRPAEAESADWLTTRYHDVLRQMRDGETLIVRLCSVYADRFTVADGNHRLATAVYHDYPNVEFELVPCFLFDSFYAWIFEYIAPDPRYARHHEFLSMAKQAHSERPDSVNAVARPGRTTL